MGHDPPCVHAVSVKAPGELIVHAAARHSLERSVDDGADLIRWLIVPAVQQQRDGARVRELGLRCRIHR